MLIASPFLALVPGSSRAAPEPPGSQLLDSVWRCTSIPDVLECDDDLVNDIEEIIDRDWPVTLTVPMPALPYTCTKKPGTGHQIIGTPPTTNFTSSLAWQLTLTTDLRSFLIGRFNASADIAGTVQVSGWDITTTAWPSTTVNYNFNEAQVDVFGPNGSTGVRNLGAVQFSSPIGAFWTGNIPIVLDTLADGDWDCLIGYSSATRVRAGGVNVVRASYPIGWTGAHDAIAQAVRTRFEDAVVKASEGDPLDCTSCHPGALAGVQASEQCPLDWDLPPVTGPLAEMFSRTPTAVSTAR